MMTLGIDIAGAPNKHFDLALVEWGNKFGDKSNVFWTRLPLGSRKDDYPNYNTEGIRRATKQGDLENIAKLTFDILDKISNRLNKSIRDFGIGLQDIDVIAIDSPSGFSRNLIGHGRATEKVWKRFKSQNGINYNVSFQMSPSISCNKYRGNSWFWMIFGMAAFHLLDNEFRFNNGSWLSYLVNGVINKDNVIEIFPRVTIHSLRMQKYYSIEILSKILNNLDDSKTECQLISKALKDGKKTGSDRADALISALTPLPFIYPEYFKLISLMHDDPSNYQCIGDIPWDKEGIIRTLKAV
jgi:hypothetical protein